MTAVEPSGAAHTSLRAALATRQAAPAWIVLALSLTAAGLGWRAVDSAVHDRAEARFRFESDQLVATIEGRMLDYETALRSGRGLFDASDGVSRREWRVFADDLQLQRFYPGIQGLGFALMISPADKEAHVAEIRAEGFPAYTIRPDSPRDLYSSIIFLEPFDWRNQRAFGYDMFSEPVRRLAMEAARDSGEPAVSGRVTLVQETSEDVQYGFLMYMPVYRWGVGVGTVAERRAALLGFVYSPFRARDLMNGMLRGGARNIEVELYDGPAPDRAFILHDSAREQAAGRQIANHRPDFERVHALVTAGRAWTLRTYSRPGFHSSWERSETRLVAIGGGLINLLILLVLVQLVRRNADKELRRTLEAARHHADAASLAKSRFLATMSHEIRTPLNGVMGMAQILMEAGISEAQRIEYARTIARSGHTLLSLLNDVLDLSRIEAGKLDLARVDFAPGQVLADTMALYRGVAEAEGILLSASWEGPAEARYRGDPRRIGQMLNNLVSNAVKYTEAGRIEVRAREVEAAAEGLPATLFFSVKDTGIGVPRDRQGALFRPFSQIDVSDERNAGGTGLGLSIVSSLAAAMRGEVGVESEGGQGSTFWFRVQVGSAEDPSAAPAVEGSNVIAAPPPPISVLVVDDEVTNRLVLELMLVKLGAEVRCVEDGAEALAAIERGEVPHLVLMDVQMPVMGGFEATAAIRRREGVTGHLPIVALTARVLADDRERCLGAGMDDFLAKPVILEDLRAMLKKWARPA